MTTLLREDLPAVSANLLVTAEKVEYNRQSVNISILACHGLLVGRYTTISDRFHNHATTQLTKKGALITHYIRFPCD